VNFVGENLDMLNSNTKLKTKNRQYVSEYNLDDDDLDLTDYFS
jgi:hypothetical protein